MSTVDPPDLDVCVVGGGPGGMTLAVLLARSGLRVGVVEARTSLERPYRGEILQPGGAALLDAMGVLAGAAARGAHPHDRFRFVDRGRVLADVDYRRRLPGPHNCLRSLPQRHLLAELTDQAAALGVTLWNGSRVVDLVHRGPAVAGVVLRSGRESTTVRARLVVGADGRYSKVRRLAGIASDRLDAFDHDVVWFRLPCPPGTPDAVRIFRSDGDPAMVYRSHPDMLQVGWVLPHGRWREVADRGVEHAVERIARAVPELAGPVREHVTDLSALTLLDVFSASAREWVRDGLLLLGDAAHTHSPIGAQGIGLAVQDAVAAHPVLVDALRRGDTGAAALAPFARRRRRVADLATRIQIAQSRVMLSGGRVADVVRPVLAPVASRSPVFRLVLRRLAHGDPRVRVADELFVRPTPTPTPTPEPEPCP